MRDYVTNGYETDESCVSERFLVLKKAIINGAALDADSSGHIFIDEKPYPYIDFKDVFEFDPPGEHFVEKGMIPSDAVDSLNWLLIAYIKQIDPGLNVDGKMWSTRNKDGLFCIMDYAEGGSWPVVVFLDYKTLYAFYAYAALHFAGYRYNNGISDIFEEIRKKYLND